MKISLLLLNITIIGVTIALISDLKTGMIFNWLTVPLFLMGLGFAFYFNGLLGVGLAIIAGVLTFVTTFRFGKFGGGDLKLAMAIGSCLGLGLWPVYFVGMGITRIFFTLLIKVKTYTLSGLFQGLRCEVITNEIIPVNNNFRIFQEAGKKAGYEGSAPTIPGAIWVAGGVYAVALYLIYPYFI